MGQRSLISARILEDMTNGVMAVDRTGRIITFNPAAAVILGIGQEDALRHSFGELFLDAEGNDEFNQVMLDAVYDSAVRHNRIVPYHRHGRVATLAMSTSLLRDDEGGEGSIGVIAVFSDITELQKLREAEERLTGELQSKHRELQEAYLKTEEGNRNLQAALKKVQVIRITATAFTILLFLGIGLFFWRSVPRRSGPAAAPPVTAGPAARGEYTVAPQNLSAAITLTGKFQPRELVTVAAPLSGKLLRSHVRYGEVVAAGQPLVTMDPGETVVKLREARSACIKARANFRQLESWEQSGDMARARRSLTKARMALENQKKTLEESERLFKKGIIPASEYESARHQYTNQTLDFQSAEEEVRAAADKGNSEQVTIARHELENAEARLKQLEAELAGATVTAPVAGIVMKPVAPGGAGKEGKALERGTPFQQGEALLAVGDLTGFAVECKVDEVDVTRVKVGQPVRITGDAFPGIRLDGRIRAVSPHAELADKGGAPTFGVSVVVDSVVPELRHRIFVGMSANLEIVILDRKDALMVPLSAVITAGGKRFVMVKRGSGPSEKRAVTTGQTTQDAVELVSGVKAGEVIETGGEPPPGGKK